MSVDSPAIEVRQLVKHYGKTVAVDDLSFDVHPGQVTGFLGPNGAGKSTTLRMILGLDERLWLTASRSPLTTDLCSRSAPFSTPNRSIPAAAPETT
jgi:ABC-type glutathione transport system ATPase component